MPAAAELFAQDQVPFRGAEIFPVSRRKGSEFQFPNFHSDQAQGGVTDAGGHFPNLAVLSLGEFQTDPAVGHVFTKPDRGNAGWQGRLGFQKPSLAGKRGSAFDDHALGKFLQGI